MGAGVTAPSANGKWTNVLDDGEDVSGVSDRALVIRAANAMIASEQAIGCLMREIAEVRDDVRELQRDTTGLHAAVRAALGLAREAGGRMPSAHEIAVEVAEEITSPGVIPTSTKSDRVREIARADRERDELVARREQERESRTRRQRVADAVMGGAVLAAVVEILRVLLSIH